MLCFVVVFPGLAFEIVIAGPKGPIQAEIEDRKDGTYFVSYAPENSGVHKVDVTLDKQPIKGMWSLCLLYTSHLVSLLSHFF